MPDVEVPMNYEEMVRKSNFPHVGQIVRNKKSGDLWRVMAREVWRQVEHDPKGEPRIVPTIYLSFWQVRKGVPPGVGKMEGHLYNPDDISFTVQWEVFA